MKKVFLYFLPLLSSLAGHAQTWKWERSGGSGFTWASNIAVDKFGNSYFLTAQDSSTIDDKKGKPIAKINNAALVKLSPDGNVVWEAPILFTTAFEYYYFYSGIIEIAPNGHIIVCANLPGAPSFGRITIPLDPKHPVSRYLHSNDFWTQLVLAECDTSGTWVQAIALGSTTIDTYLSGMTIDKDSNAFINISYSDSLIIGNASYRSVPYDSFSEGGSTLLGSFKMNQSVNWTDNFPGLISPAFFENSGYCDLSQHGSLYLLLHDTLSSEYIYKINPNGSPSFIKNIPANISSIAPVSNIELDKEGNIYAIGILTDTIDFGNGIILKGGIGNGFLVKYDSGFNPQWGTVLKATIYSEFSSISIDGSGNIYTLGSFEGQLRLGDSVYYAPYLQTLFIAEYAPEKTMIMETVVQVTNRFTAVYDNNLTLDSSGSLIIDGLIVRGSVQFGCDTLIGFDTYAYIAKLDPRPLTTSKIPFCTGDSLICTDTSLYHNLTWKFRDGTMQTGNRIAYYGKTGVYYHFTVYATNSVGCNVFISDSFRHPAPPVAIFSTKDSVACEFTKVILNDISHTDTLRTGNWPRDTWSFGDGTVSKSTKTATKIYQDTGTFTIKLSYDNGFCSIDTSMNITVISAPKPGFRVANFSKVVNSGDTATLSGCPPMSVQVTDQSLGSVTAWEYVVQKLIPLPPSKGDTLRMPAFSYDFLTPGQYTIHQYLTGPSGCVTEDSITIIVNPLPTVVYAGPDSICFGSAIRLGGPPKAGYIYSWTAVPRGFYSSLSNPVDTPKTNTVYDLKETIAATGCTDSGMAVSCFVQALPIASFAYEYVRGFEYRFTVKGAKNVSYHFDFGDSQHVSFSYNDSVIFHTYPSDGTYTTTLTATSGTNLTCDAYQTDTIVINEPFSLNIFPNPFGLQTDINYMLLKPGHVRISLTDDIGRQIGTLLDKQLGPGEYDTEFSGASWKTRPGMYFVLFQLDDTLIVKKIIQIDSIYY